MTTEQRIVTVLERFWTARKPYTDEDLAAAIAEELRPSFTEAIVKNGECSRKCSLGHTHVVYMLTWRQEYVPALRIVRDQGPITTAQLCRTINTPTGRKVLSELVHFDLVAVCGVRAGDRLYQITDHGRAFLDGKEPCHTHVWPKGQKLPEQCVDSEPRFVQQVIADHPGNQPAVHAEMAVAV